MYTINNINKRRRLKKIDLDCSFKVEEGYICLFTGHDKSIDELFDILGSFTAKYNGEFLYGSEEKENVLENPELINEIESSAFLQDYNSSVEVKKYLRLKGKLSPHFDEESVSSVPKGFTIDEFARLEGLKEDYCNVVLMTAALATSRKVVLLKNFEITDRKLSLEFINIMKERQESIRDTVLISAPIVEGAFFDYSVLMQNGRIKFKDSKHNILTEANVVRGPKEIMITTNYKRILTRTSDGPEDGIKMFDGINEDKRALLENNGCTIKQLPSNELITMTEGGNYEKTVKTKIVD